MRKLPIKILLTGMILVISCQKDLSPIPGSTFNLSVESIECTQTWLTLSVNQPDKNTIYTVKRDTHLVFSGAMQQIDTLLHDTGLEPASDILYQVIQRIDGHDTGENIITVSTMDTTSQNFKITTFSFGSGYIRDVAIIDEEHIWAVGRFYLDDTLYTAMYTDDGKNWKLFSNKTKVGTGRLPSEIDVVIATDLNNVFLVNGPRIIKWNGQIFKETLYMQDYRNSEFYSDNGSVWVKDDSSFILGDHNGNLVFTNGYEYEYFDTGIRSSIYKICGAPKKSGDGYDIFAALGSIYDLTDQNILRIEGTTFEPALDWPQDGTRLYSIWFKDMNKIYVSKSDLNGIATYGPDNKWNHDTRLDAPWLIRNIEGNDINDIWATGEQHYTAHFNGIRWKYFSELERFGPLYGMDVKGDVMVAGGYSGTVVIIKRK